MVLQERAATTAQPQRDENHKQENKNKNKNSSARSPSLSHSLSLAHSRRHSTAVVLTPYITQQTTLPPLLQPTK